MEPHRKYDIVIFGATSFTGKYLVHEVLKALSNGDKFSWAIAARSVEKMEELLHSIGKDTGKDLSAVDKIIADVFNPPSLVAMAKQAHVILNCVGPYMQWGEAVVKACSEEGTHHLDLSGEPLFLGRMEQKYSAVAEDSGAYIVGACGFDSIPSDYGASYIQQNFEGDVNSIESFVDIGSDNSSVSTLHYGTWHSGVLMMHRIRELLPLRRQIAQDYHPPKPSYKLPFRPIQYRSEINSWCMFVPFPDGDVMERTQRYAFVKEKRKPVQTRAYIQFPSLLTTLFVLIGSFFLGLFAQFKFGLRLLEKYPKLFSLGYASHEGPSVEDMNKTKFTFTLVAKGWSEKKEHHDEPPNKVKILKVRGTNPAYGGTVTLFLQAAITIISERERMPSKGGVYSPGVAFARTTLIDRLNRNGVTFSLQK
ncbi:unnamed protein product [Orchesella dallaii]|uniref:Saccharopine dehydrogenase NADP binding domain-containing protein n=1 Tax=Orchesella dallaii TaxID=48710 RepID=A0ABP1RTJ4_9HEXA